MNGQKLMQILYINCKILLPHLSTLMKTIHGTLGWICILALAMWLRKYRHWSKLQFFSDIQMGIFLAELSGVCSVGDDTCINSCIAYTGPFKDLQTCPECGEHCFWPIYQKSLPAASYNSTRSSIAGNTMKSTKFTRSRLLLSCYRENNKGSRSLQWKIPLIKDFFSQGYIDGVDEKFIKEYGKVLIFSMDDAQLYASKASDCWIYIGIIFDYISGNYYRKSIFWLEATFQGQTSQSMQTLSSFLVYTIWQLCRERDFPYGIVLQTQWISVIYFLA